MADTTKIQQICEDFAIQQGFTKQQTIAFQILAIFEAGYGIGRAVEMVCGPEAMETIAGTNWTAEALLNAVRASFFEHA